MKTRTTTNFRAVEYMRETREKMTRYFQTDQQGYLEHLKAVLSEFKKKKLGRSIESTDARA